MSRYSLLAGFAYNTAQQFATSANHFACLAWRSGMPTVEIDLLSGDIQPAPFRLERNRILVRKCAGGLATRVAHSAPVPAVLAAARLGITFDLSEVPADAGGAPPPALSATFTVTLRDELAREHTATLADRIIVQC